MPKKIYIDCGAIQLIVYDFDGVMTNDKVIVSEDGKESVMVNRGDGLAVSMIRNIGIPQLILSTETNKIVKARAKKLSVPVLSGIADKKKALRRYCHRNNIDLKKVVFVGNDINDIDAMRIVGYPITPKDAHKTVKKNAKLITKAKGGEGVVRELYSVLKKEPFS